MSFYEWYDSDEFRENVLGIKSKHSRSNTEDYIIGLDLAKPDTMDNSILQVEIIVPKQGDINSYFNKPVLLDNKPIGTIIKATQVDSGYKLSVMIWLRTVKIYNAFINNDLNSISIGLDRKSVV